MDRINDYIFNTIDVWPDQIQKLKFDNTQDWLDNIEYNYKFINCRLFKTNECFLTKPQKENNGYISYLINDQRQIYNIILFDLNNLITILKY